VDVSSHDEEADEMVRRYHDRRARKAALGEIRMKVRGRTLMVLLLMVVVVVVAAAATQIKSGGAGVPSEVKHHFHHSTFLLSSRPTAPS